MSAKATSKLHQTTFDKTRLERYRTVSEHTSTPVLTHMNSPIEVRTNCSDE